MVRLTPDSHSQRIAFLAVGLGAVALVLCCVGIGTPKWYTTWSLLPGSSTAYYATRNLNFFYACTFNTNTSLINCTSRTPTLYGYPYGANPWEGDYYQRLQNAGALCIVGIIFLFFGTVATLIMALIYLDTWFNLIAPALLFLACLFMLAGMAEGSRYFLFNDYSANLYQAGHLLTMVTLFLSSFAAGRIHFSRWTRTGPNIDTT